MSKYFAIEVPDGGGKTTLLELIKAEFNRRGERFIALEEPGESGDRAELRRIMTDPQTTLDPADKNIVRTLLMMADRIMIRKGVHVATHVGVPILASRCFMSTVVYQGLIGGEMELVELILERANLIYPDVIFVLKVEPETLRQRMYGRRELDDLEKTVAKDVELYMQMYVHAAPLIERLTKGKTKIIYLDGNASPDEVYAEAMVHIKDHMGWN